ncbi:MAG: hypothetical protein KZQ64_09485 [gamma proteobacterium symbiont of Bathyaustriella thionipta]|nr:hypothetical protein [gamma proteobacterium symbiont of Bathyaustriella thionipta]MCU7949401.1 hypothetical protein [gamma proteobacterium symbiont of Bathyaustriella thionipta]MCU7953606.1 hypothetical protein [gamma proteobacterium symbiont of Bathyaustriella thionipta]MCU7956255.1 hypothetical protein [gamma proteobacterium symbiont of Bathyaustriella thionipta]MCU7965989.1 hypothetical protein [gamma proteobacterium symbiont of Bathyaustriella thionipta]
MKPGRSIAMQQLIEQVRVAMPFDLPEANLCSGKCNGCSQKLLDYLDTELEDWELRLKSGELPDFGEIQRIAKTSKKIYKVMQRNGLVSNLSKK